MEVRTENRTWYFIYLFLVSFLIFTFKTSMEIRELKEKERMGEKRVQVVVFEFYQFLI